MPTTNAPPTTQTAEYLDEATGRLVTPFPDPTGPRPRPDQIDIAATMASTPIVSDAVAPFMFLWGCIASATVCLLIALAVHAAFGGSQ